MQRNESPLENDAEKDTRSIIHSMVPSEKTF